MKSQERKPKKCDSIEVRVPYELKQDFMRRAATEGRSASDLLRTFMESYLAPKKKVSPMVLATMKPKALLTVAGAAVVMSVAVPMTAQAAPDLKELFDQFDVDEDGTISKAEFSRAMMTNKLIRPGNLPPPVAGRKVLPYPGPAPTPGSKDQMVGPGVTFLPAPQAQPLILPVRGALPMPGGIPVPAVTAGDEFDRRDFNRDGKVEFDEFRRHHQQLMQAGFRSSDRNADGFIDADEMQAIRRYLPGEALGPDLGKLDCNGDGKVSFEEFTE